MAFLGVRQSGVGSEASTKLAQTLADSYFGNAEDELKAAQIRQEMESEAWRRRVWDAQAAQANAVANKDTWELETRQENLPIVQDYRAGLVEAPVPVEQAPELAVAPREVATQPVPVDYDPIDPGAPNIGASPDALGDLYELPAPATELDPLLYDTPAPVVLPEDQEAYDREVAAARAETALAIAGGGNAAQMAQGLGIGEGAIKLRSSDPDTQREGELLYTGDAGKTTAAVGGKAAQEMRKEIVALPAYKDFADIQGVYSSMLQSAKLDTKAAVMDMVYGIATMEDPGSVVRESDQIMVQRTGGLSGAVQAAISYFNENGELTPEMRAGIMQIAANRYGGYKNAFDKQMAQYRGRAERQGLLLEDVIPEFEEMEAYQGSRINTAQRRGNQRKNSSRAARCHHAR